MADDTPHPLSLKVALIIAAYEPNVALEILCPTINHAKGHTEGAFFEAQASEMTFVDEVKGYFKNHSARLAEAIETVGDNDSEDDELAQEIDVDTRLAEAAEAFESLHWKTYTETNPVIQKSAIKFYKYCHHYTHALLGRKIYAANTPDGMQGIAVLWAFGAQSPSLQDPEKAHRYLRSYRRLSRLFNHLKDADPLMFSVNKLTLATDLTARPNRPLSARLISPLRTIAYQLRKCAEDMGPLIGEPMDFRTIKRRYRINTIPLR